MIKNKNQLALFKGPKSIYKKFKNFNNIGIEELNAVTKVMKSGILSEFLAGWSDKFYGGKKVLEFEKKCSRYFGSKYAVTVNSWTSGLTAALGAIDLQPGDEVITSPWTMSASATCILHWNAIPVFADIDENTFCINSQTIKKKITSRTRAILVVDIFGRSAEMTSILSLAKKHNLRVISDSAQAIGSKYKNKFTGTLCDIGGFSFNYHKHIHTGEGGVLFTNNKKFYEKMCLIRNHAEQVIVKMKTKYLSNMIGYNYRMGELESAIGIEQLKKLKSIVKRRRQIAKKLDDGLSNLSSLLIPINPNYISHSYYVYGMILEIDKLKISRELICKALLAEGVPVRAGYINVHLLPIFQKKIAYGNKGFPWISNFYNNQVKYNKGICPTAERLEDKTFIQIGLCNYEWTDQEVDLIVKAFKKVWQNLDKLKKSSLNNYEKKTNNKK